MNGALKQIEIRYNNTDGKNYAAALGSHAETERWRYTVPAGKRAIVTHIFAMVNPTAAAGTAQVHIKAYLKGGTVFSQIVLLQSITTLSVVFMTAVNLYLDAGDYIALTTYSVAGGSIYMGGACSLVEYDH